MDGALSLVAVTPSGTSVVPLPERGTLTVGRGDACDIRLADSSLSRVHAELRVDGGVTFVDLGSTNGSFVRDARVAPHSPVPLQPGVVASIGETLLIVRRSDTPPERSRLALTPAYFEMRVREECVRKAPFALVHLRIDQDFSNATTEAIPARPLAALLQAADVVANYAPNEYDVLFAGTRPEEAEERAENVRTALERASLCFTLAVACYPRDGMTFEELRAATRDPDPERRRILQALARCGGNQREAAALLGISRSTLMRRIKRYGMRGPRRRA